jgi:hypothetical protein
MHAQITTSKRSRLAAPLLTKSIPLTGPACLLALPEHVLGRFAMDMPFLLLDQHLDRAVGKTGGGPITWRDAVTGVELTFSDALPAALGQDRDWRLAAATMPACVGYESVQWFVGCSASASGSAFLFNYVDETGSPWACARDSSARLCELLHRWAPL